MKKLYSLILLVFSFISVNAQNVEVYGVIRDAETKETLPGAHVTFGKPQGGTADVSGAYRIFLPPGNHELTFSFVGYDNLKMKITLEAGNRKEVNASMQKSNKQLNMVVVSASNYEKSVMKETVTSEQISKKVIQNTNSNDLGEAVQRTPGVLVQDGQVSIRGGSSYSYGVGSRTAIMVDGLGMMSADLGDGQLKMAPLANTKRIEVIKGASSVVYGSSALNGVVNVITEWPTSEKPQTELGVNIGFYNDPIRGEQKWWDGAQPFFSMVNVNHQQKIKNLQFVAGGNFTGISSYLQFANEFRAGYYFKTRILNKKIDGLNYGINGSMMFEGSDRFFISQDLDTFSLYRAQGSNDKYLRTTIDPHLSYSNNKGHSYTMNSRYLNIFRRGNGGDPNAVSHMFMMDNKYQYRHKKDLYIITAGFPFNMGFSTSNLYPGLRTNFSGAVYGQAEVNYKWLSAIGGVRYEINKIENILITTLPVFRGGLNFEITKSTYLRTSWGQAYRVPTIGERFIAQNFTAGVFIFPNADLKVERGWSAEVGLKQGFIINKWKGYVDASLYWQEFNNFIEYRFGFYDNKDEFGKPIFPEEGTQVLGLRPFNVEKARIGGYELAIAGSGKIGPVEINTLMGYTYVYPGNLDSAANRSIPNFFNNMFRDNFRTLLGKESETLLQFRNRHIVRGDIEFTWKKLSVGGTVYYMSFPERIPAIFAIAISTIDGGKNTFEKYIREHARGDFTADVRMGYQVNEKLRLGFIVKNVANRLYYMRPGRPEPLRNFTLQLRYTF